MVKKNWQNSTINLEDRLIKTFETISRADRTAKIISKVSDKDIAVLEFSSATNIYQLSYYNDTITLEKQESEYPIFTQSKISKNKDFKKAQSNLFRVYSSIPKAHVEEIIAQENAQNHPILVPLSKVFDSSKGSFSTLSCGTPTYMSGCGKYTFKAPSPKCVEVEKNGELVYTFPNIMPSNIATQLKKRQKLFLN